MRELNEREKRTIRWGGVGIVVYLAIFYGVSGWRYLEAQRAEYAALGVETLEVEARILGEIAKGRRLAKLERELSLSPAPAVPEARIQAARSALGQLAVQEKVQLGSTREVAGRTRAGELRRFHLSGTGPIASVARFVEGARSLGMPLSVDDLTVDTSGLAGGVVRFSIDVALFDFETWKKSRRKKRDA